MRIHKLISIEIINNILLVLIVLFLFHGESVRARTDLSRTVPSLISYQGMLSDANGDPVSGTKDIKISIYNSVSGGTALWSETYPSLVVKNGVFLVLLGSQTPFPEGLFNEPERWLEVSVQGEALTLRQRFTSVPYALNAEKLAGHDASEFAPAMHNHPGTDISSDVPGAVTAKTADYALNSDLLDGKHASDLVKPGLWVMLGEN